MIKPSPTKRIPAYAYCLLSCQYGILTLFSFWWRHPAPNMTLLRFVLPRGGFKFQADQITVFHQSFEFIRDEDTGVIVFRSAKDMMPFQAVGFEYVTAYPLDLSAW